MPKLNVLIAGSTGYIGVQLIKLLIKHKNINIKYLCGNSSVGKKISFYDDSLKSKKLPRITKYFLPISIPSGVLPSSAKTRTDSPARKL